MLRHRLILGTVMTVVFTAVVVFDGWLDGALTASAIDDKPIKGTLLCILIALLIIPAQLELSRLAAAKNLKVFTPVCIVASIFFATAWYWRQFINMPPHIYLFFLSAFVLLTLLLYQRIYYGVTSVLANCGTSYLTIAYLGFLGSFLPAIRIDFGLWPLLMFVFVVKSADIGAYAIGSLCGKHKFSPIISPGKTWEGMAGAVIAAAAVAITFAVNFDIMSKWQAVVFGVCFAFIGQFGDLAESMMKRDAEQKDASNSIPGFGGILDVIDSPLGAAPFAYLFFMLFGK